MKNALVVAAALLTATQVSAQTISYPDFSNTAGLQINGNAAQNGNKLTLTPATFGQSGSAFSTSTVALSSSAAFSTVFTFEILSRGGLDWGADGLTFTVQTLANNVGGGGGGIGYEGINNSVTVEFDTYDNGEFGGSNHVAIATNGQPYSPVATTGFLAPDFDNGGKWWAWVDYNGLTQQLDVRWSASSSRPTLPMLSSSLDLPSILGSSNVYVGFTAGTGAGYGEHNILSWNFVNEFKDGGAPDPGVAPEPGTMVLVLSGLGAVGVMARRRRR